MPMVMQTIRNYKSKHTVDVVNSPCRLAAMKKGAEAPCGLCAGHCPRRQPAVLLGPILGAVFTLQIMVTARMPMTTPSETTTGIL